MRNWMKIDPVILTQVTHHSVEVDISYDSFTHNFEKILGKFDSAVATSFASDPRLADEAIKKLEGEQNLMIFGSLDHGRLFRVIGGSVRPSAMRPATQGWGFK